MGKALYRKYRSRSLEEVVGQPQVTELLARALKQGRIAHAYLFTGPKGVGKTSIARILAHEINNLPYTDESTHLDIVEIDAASNNGVEDIRDLREKVRLAPTSAPKKVYIIDEVHMLSKPAFNALLKTLEEPPEHVVFILATTDIDKIPGTILSRTQRHNFRRATDADIVKNLQRIAKEEDVTVSNEALEIIARHSDGSFRDSVSLFDQLVSLADKKEGISKSLVSTSLGLATDDHIEALLEASVRHDIAVISRTLDELAKRGTPTKTILHQLVELIHQRMVQQPELIQLLDQLLELHKATMPDMKLLTTLALYKDAPRDTVQAPAEKNMASTATITESQSANDPEDVAANIPTPKAAENVKKASSKAAPAKPAAERPKTAPKRSSKMKAATEFDWPKLLEHVRTHHVALHSVLSRCEPEISGETLTLYTKGQFYKKRLDDSKYRALLTKSLGELNFAEYEIETKPTALPPKDSQAAKVAAMMGGGEEVKLDGE